MRVHEKVRYHLGFDKNFAIHRSNVTMLRIMLVLLLVLLLLPLCVSIDFGATSQYQGKMFDFIGALFSVMLAITYYMYINWVLTATTLVC